MLMKVKVNGKMHEIDKERVPHLGELVSSMVKNDTGLIVEQNEKIVNRNHWQEHQVNDGDVIELINLVGGG